MCQKWGLLLTQLFECDMKKHVQASENSVRQRMVPVMNRGRRGETIFKEKKRSWLHKDYVLKMFSENRAESRKRYSKFILLETPEEILQMYRWYEIWSVGHMV
ncbi:MAG: hypothetical protein BBJ57_07895 [Desulfobacterales bacterium PC51MH44]|nr:MAG: hypothetical protein BBJ57_07895 [Desulfobacterales bacterium PC51MH44]